MNITEEQRPSAPAGQSANGEARRDLDESWQRSRAAGVDAGARLPPRRADEAELGSRLRANAELVAVARPHLEWINATLDRVPHAVALSDRDGIVLVSLGPATGSFARRAGEDWSESSAAANEIGTALAADRLVIIRGPEYFLTVLHDCAGAGAPVHAPEGVVVGVVSLSLSAVDANSERLALAEHVARVVERELAFREQIRATGNETAARRHAEESLKRSEAHLRLVADHAPTFIAQCDRQGRYKYVNRGYAERFGLKPEEVVGKTIADILGAEGYEVVRPHIELALAGQAVEFEVVIPYERIGRRIMHCAYEPERNDAGEVDGLVAVITDMTEWKQVEEELRKVKRELEDRVAERTAELSEANEFLQALLENLREGIVACNSVGEITLLNDPNGPFTDLGMDSVPAARWAAMYDFFQADGQTSLKSQDIPLFRALGGEHVQSMEMVMAPRRGGRARSVLASGQAFYDAEGALLGAVMLTHDITGRKRVEEALRRAHEELEQRVAERTAELARANEALKEADRLKDEFLAMLAHELRNPLAPIRNALHIMHQPAIDRDVVDKARRMAERQVQHMARLLDDLLDMARIRRGRIELRRQPVEIGPLAQRTAESIRLLVDERRHRLAVSVPPEPIWVEGDPTRLEQIFTNLLNNACKYTDPGGTITLTVEREDGQATIRVKDTGIGIEPAMLGRVFDLFVQVERRVDRAQGGVGIGLTLVKKLVELHNGTIEARSEGKGKGSEFMVRLPALTAPPKLVPAPKKTESWSALGLPDFRVLVVDDNEDAADSLAMLLALSGQQVRAVYDGPSALAIANDFHPTMAFVDIGMPGMDGHEVARQLRQKPELQDLVLVALTGWGQEEDRRRSEEAGFDHHLVKPVEPGVLKKLLSELQLKE